MKHPKCATCKKFREIRGRHLRGNFANYSIRARTTYGAFLINAAELFLTYRPRKPIKITARSLDNYFRSHSWSITKKHLPHVDPRKPGIMATITHDGRKRLYLIEGFHRATLHRQSREDWACYVLTPKESYATLAPMCECEKGVK